MGSPDAAALLSLAESIADGASIDWAAAEAGASGGDRVIVRQLRVLADLAGLHRSLSVSTGPAPGVAIPRATVAAPVIGSWGHLSLIERLGGGTSGDVYCAWDRDLERDVALKLLRGDESIDDLRASRITHEGRLLARVRHQNVITVYGVAAHDDRVGLWMELVRGVTLEQQVTGHGPLSAHEAAMVGIDLCRALAAIHAAGLIHRDVKAQNVMREDGGRIVLMDLGTGREAGALRRTGTPDLAGTPLYLAPEIFDGAAASERTDLYSLGVLLYHLVTGVFPVRATTLQQLHEGHRKGLGVRLRDARANLPTAFVRAIDRAIAADPEQRYATAGEFEADLAEALADFTASGTIRTPVRPVEPSSEPNESAARSLPPLAVLAVAIALILTIALVGWQSLRRSSAPTAVPAGPIRSIAVLPLVNLSGDPAQDYFADGMTDELIGTLGHLAGVKVISRTSAMHFKGSKLPLPEIARALHVDAVLEGTVMVLAATNPGQSGRIERVRINARLIHAGTDTQLWDKKFETVVTDIFTMQKEVVKAVADGIHLRLTGSAAAHRPQDFESFDLYLKGRYYWNMRTEAGLKQSIQYFQEAIDRNPNYALGYSGLADAYNVLAQYGYAPWTETIRRARDAATQALELDDSLAEPHVSLAFVQNQQLEWAAAEAGFKRALTLKPSYAVGHHWYANCLMQLGRFPEALAEIDRAMELNPLSIGVNGARGSVLLVARRYDEAVTQLQKTTQMDPTVSRAHMILAEAYAHQGDYGRALAEINRAAALQSGGGAALRADIAYVLAVSGRRADALKLVVDLTNRFRQGEGGAAGSLGVAYAGLGDVDRAFDWLNRAQQLADPIVPDLKTDPRLDRLRTDHRFGKLLASAGFAP